MAGPVVKNSVLLIGFRFFQGDAFYRHSLQVDVAVIPAVAKIQGILPLGNQHIFFFPFGPHHEAAEQPAGEALMISRLSLRKGYSGETSSESFSKSSLLRMMTFATSKTPGT